jgi:Bacterial Ig-like domain (group 2)
MGDIMKDIETKVKNIAMEAEMTKKDKKDQLTWFERHPNLTSLIVLLVANLIGFGGLREVGNSEPALGVVLVILSVVLSLGAEIWNIHQKGRSQFNLLWNLIPYIGFFMVLLLEHKLVSVSIISPDNLTVGSTLQINAVGTRLNGSTKKITEAVWNSSNPSSAAVTAAGLVTGVASGKSEITVTLDGVSNEPFILTVRDG